MLFHMAIPDFQSLMLPILRYLHDGREHEVADIRARIAAEFHISDQDQAVRLPSGTTTLFMNRVGWALTHLKGAQTIRSVRRATYSITERGASLVTLPAVNMKVLNQFPEYRELRARTANEDNSGLSAPQLEPKATPEETLESSFEALRDALLSEIQETLTGVTPGEFERIVVDLLLAMGYGGSIEGAGEVVGKSGDGGIDGIIKQDKLGLDAIYIQAKRWADSVGSPEIMKFSGGLTKKHATRGVFITTSTFTKDARDFVQGMPQKIVLIDGRQLASLMIDYNVGVSLRKTYVLKRLDPGYFEDL